jgi:hypothetical protein
MPLSAPTCLTCFLSRLCGLLGGVREAGEKLSREAKWVAMGRSVDGLLPGSPLFYKQRVGNMFLT